MAKQNIGKFLFSPIEQLLKSSNVKKSLSPSEWQEQLKPGKTVNIEGLNFPITEEEFRFSGIQNIPENTPTMNKQEMVDYLNRNKLDMYLETLYSDKNYGIGKLLSESEKVSPFEHNLSPVDGTINFETPYDLPRWSMGDNTYDTAVEAIEDQTGAEVPILDQLKVKEARYPTTSVTPGPQRVTEETMLTYEPNISDEAKEVQDLIASEGLGNVETSLHSLEGPTRELAAKMFSLPADQIKSLIAEMEAQKFSPHTYEDETIFWNRGSRRLTPGGIPIRVNDEDQSDLHQWARPRNPTGKGKRYGGYRGETILVDKDGYNVDPSKYASLESSPDISEIKSYNKSVIPLERSNLKSSLKDKGYSFPDSVDMSMNSDKQTINKFITHIDQLNDMLVKSYEVSGGINEYPAIREIFNSSFTMLRDFVRGDEAPQWSQELIPLIDKYEDHSGYFESFDDSGSGSSRASVEDWFSELDESIGNLLGHAKSDLMKAKNIVDLESMNITTPTGQLLRADVKLKTLDEEAPPRMPFKKNYSMVSLKKDLDSAIKDGDQYLVWPKGKDIAERGGSESGHIQYYDKQKVKDAKKLLKQYTNSDSDYQDDFQMFSSDTPIISSEELSALSPSKFSSVTNEDIESFAKKQWLRLQDFSPAMDDMKRDLANAGRELKKSLETKDLEKYKRAYEQIVGISKGKKVKWKLNFISPPTVELSDVKGYDQLISYLDEEIADAKYAAQNTLSHYLESRIMDRGVIADLLDEHLDAIEQSSIPISPTFKSRLAALSEEMSEGISDEALANRLISLRVEANVIKNSAIQKSKPVIYSPTMSTEVKAFLNSNEEDTINISLSNIISDVRSRGLHEHFTSRLSSEELLSKSPRERLQALESAAGTAVEWAYGPSVERKIREKIGGGILENQSDPLFSTATDLSAELDDILDSVDTIGYFTFMRSMSDDIQNGQISQEFERVYQVHRDVMDDLEGENNTEIGLAAASSVQDELNAMIDEGRFSANAEIVPPPEAENLGDQYATEAIIASADDLSNQLTDVGVALDEGVANALEIWIENVDAPNVLLNQIVSVYEELSDGVNLDESIVVTLKRALENIKDNLTTYSVEMDFEDDASSLLKELDEASSDTGSIDDVVKVVDEILDRSIDIVIPEYYEELADNLSRVIEGNMSMDSDIPDLVRNESFIELRNQLFADANPKNPSIIKDNEIAWMTKLESIPSSLNMTKDDIPQIRLLFSSLPDMNYNGISSAALKDRAVKLMNDMSRSLNFSSISVNRLFQLIDSVTDTIKINKGYKGADKLESWSKSEEDYKRQEFHAIKISPELKKKYGEVMEKVGAGFSQYVAPFAIAPGAWEMYQQMQEEN